jgi:hypothetical protein
MESTNQKPGIAGAFMIQHPHRQAIRCLMESSMRLRSAFRPAVLTLACAARLFASSMEEAATAVRSLPNQTKEDQAKMAVLEVALERAKASTEAGMPDEAATMLKAIRKHRLERPEVPGRGRKSP